MIEEKNNPDDSDNKLTARKPGVMLPASIGSRQAGTDDLPPSMPNRYRTFSDIPQSKNNRRRGLGPRHLHPWRLRFTALLHLITRMLFLITVIGIPLTIMSGRKDIELEVLFGPPVLLLIVGCLWLAFASRVSCRICSMRMFLSKPCTRSPKAPNFLGIGHHNTLALNALFAREVRCPYCGTPNRLVGKK